MSRYSWQRPEWGNHPNVSGGSMGDGHCYYQGQSTELFNVTLFIVSVSECTIVICSLRLQHISCSKSTSHFGTKCIRKYMTLHHTSMEPVASKRPTFLLIPHFPYLNPLYKIFSAASVATSVTGTWVQRLRICLVVQAREFYNHPHSPAPSLPKQVSLMQLL